jgi:GT2 family glycosyltransferase
MDVSIIIVNYNTAGLLYNCISSLKEKTKDLDYEIIIVDNGSSDDSCDMVRKFHPELTLIENKENLGFGRANNQGAAIARGKYLFLLNTDTLLINNAIKVLFGFMEKVENKNIAACGGNLYKADGTPNFSYSLYFPNLFRVFCYRCHLTFLLNKENFNNSGKIKDVAIIIGADLFVRRNVFNDLHGFDPDIFMYVEDGELLYRINKSGYRIVSNPEAMITHLQGSSSVKIDKLKMEIASYIVFFSKHFSPFAVIIYKLIETFFAFGRSVIYFLIFKKSKSIEYISIIPYIFKLGQISKQ